MHSIAQAISDEVRAKHNTANEEGKYDYPNGLICWAPVLNVCRDRKCMSGGERKEGSKGERVGRRKEGRE